MWSNRPHLVQREKERVDHGIAGDKDSFVRHVLLQQILTSPFGWREMKGRQMRGQDSIHFFRPRRIEITGAQTGLDMPYRTPPIKGRHRRTEYGGRVPLG